jgi:hypothetical protein
MLVRVTQFLLKPPTKLRFLFMEVRMIQYFESFQSIWRSMIGLRGEIIIFHPIVVPLIFYFFGVKLSWDCHVLCIVYLIWNHTIRINILIFITITYINTTKLYPYTSYKYIHSELRSEVICKRVITAFLLLSSSHWNNINQVTISTTLFYASAFFTSRACAKRLDRVLSSVKIKMVLCFDRDRFSFPSFIVGHNQNRGLHFDFFHFDRDLE